MKTASHSYGSDFFLDQMDGSLQSARNCVPIIQSILHAKSVVDVGCGVGTWLAAFREHGVEDVFGLDGEYVDKSLLKIPRELFRESDLAQGFSLNREFDIAISLEVAEHLPRESADRFVCSLTRLAKRIVFSAAIPGQGGTFHINEQWPSFWRDRFAAQGYMMVDCFRWRIWENDLIGGAYRQNMFLFLASSVLHENQALVSEQEIWRLPLSIVHPAVFQHALSRQPSLRPLISALPGAAARALRSRLSRPSRRNK